MTETPAWHWGTDPAFGNPTQHKGRQEDCPDPDCEPDAHTCAPHPADELRAAADKLRRHAQAVTRNIAENPYWNAAEHPPHAYPSVYARGVDRCLGGAAGAYAATMHPDVATTLAALLEHAAARLDAYTHPGWQDVVAPHELAVARAVLGGEPAR